MRIKIKRENEEERDIFLYLKRVGRPGGVEVVVEWEGRQRDKER